MSTRRHPGDLPRNCTQGTYIAGACIFAATGYGWSTFDTSRCEACPAPAADKKCPPGQRFVPCSGLSTKDDSGCQPCPNVTSCRNGEYFSAECVCSKCKVQPSNCNSSAYYIGCDGTRDKNDGACSGALFDCGPPNCNGQTNYYKKQCDASLNQQNECGPCLYNEGNVPNGSYLSEECSFFAPSKILPCTRTASSRCVPGVSRLQPCTTREDWKCVPCKRSRDLACNLAAFYYAGCSDGGETDLYCVPKTNINVPCPSGMWRKPGTCQVFFFKCT